jgi:hypothetical protein
MMLILRVLPLRAGVFDMVKQLSRTGASAAAVAQRSYIAEPCCREVPCRRKLTQPYLKGYFCPSVSGGL